MFSIEISQGPSPELAIGTITIGDFSERFRANLSFWVESDYRQSWRRAFQILESSDRATSCFVASITDPATTNFISCWPLYRAGDIVHIQNSLIFLDELESVFDPDEPWCSVQPRQTHDEDGNRISEWSIDLESMRAYFARLDGSLGL